MKAQHAWQDYNAIRGKTSRFVSGNHTLGSISKVMTCRKIASRAPCLCGRTRFLPAFGDYNYGDSTNWLSVPLTGGEIRKTMFNCVNGANLDLEDDLMGLPPIKDIVRFSSLLHPHMDITEKGYLVLDPS